MVFKTHLSIWLESEFDSDNGPRRDNSEQKERVQGRESRG